MALHLAISEPNKRDLEVIRDEEPDRLYKALEALRELGTQPVTLKEIHEKIAENASSERVARILAQQLSMLAGLGRRKAFSATEIVDALTRGTQDAGWTDDDIQKWKRISGILTEILECPALSIFAKTIDLATDYSNRLQMCRILTDIRPIFNDERMGIVGGIITNVLRITYWNEEGEHSISISLDRSDVESLGSQCEMAIAKITAARQLVEKIGKTKAIEMGGELYELD